MEEKRGLIYCVENKINGKLYVGQTSKSLKERRKAHKCSYKTSEQFFHKKLREFGLDNFEWKVVEDNIKLEDLTKREIYWIDFFDSYYNGYNMNKGSAGYYGKLGKENPNYGTHLTEEQKQQISKTKKEYYKQHPDKKPIGSKNGMYGKHLSDESKKKISDAVSGKKNPFYGRHHTEETIDKIKETLKGQMDGEKNPFYNKKHTEESKQKMSESQKKTWTDEKRKELSESKKELYKEHPEKNPMYGKNHSEETKQKLREKKIGRKLMIKDGVRKYISKEDFETYLKDSWIFVSHK